MNRNSLHLDPGALFAFDRSALDLTKPTIGLAIVLAALMLLSVIDVRTNNVPTAATSIVRTPIHGLLLSNEMLLEGRKDTIY